MKEEEIFYSAIKNECRRILEIYDKINQYLYHGYASSEPFLVRIPKENRKPKDTPGDIHDFINEIFQEIGFEVNRKNSLFFTGNQAEARKYGNVYVAFPTDDFKYLWSPKIRDFTGSLYYTFIRNMEKMPVFQYGEKKTFYILNDDKSFERLKKIVLDYFPNREKIESKKKEIISAKSLEELMDIVTPFMFDENEIRNSYKDSPTLDSYISEIFYFVATNATNITKSRRAKENFKKVFKSLYKENEDIEKAIDSWHEVMIRARKVYLVSYDQFRDNIDLKWTVKRLLGKEK